MLTSNEYPNITLIPDPSCDYNVTDFVAPSELDRDWFDPHFYYCLPLSGANTLGWTLFSPYDFSVIWNGGKQKQDITIESEIRDWPMSWFGSGIFTIHPKFLVRTSPNIDLLVRPVPNYYKRGVLTMEGLIEADRHQGSFTLNFRIAEPNVRIHYQAGEPLVQFVLYARGFIEQFDARVLTTGPEYDTIRAEAVRWGDKRIASLAQMAAEDRAKRDFSDMHGDKQGGDKSAAYQKRIHLKPFSEVAADENDSEALPE